MLAAKLAKALPFFLFLGHDGNSTFSFVSKTGSIIKDGKNGAGSQCKGEHGLKKVTMQMIADKIGVSKALVSKALSNDPTVSEETRERIWQTAQEMGYRFDSLRKKPSAFRTGNIAVLMPEVYLRDMQYWGRVIRGIDRELSASGVSMMMSGIDPSADAGDSLPVMIKERKVDGLLLLGHIPAKTVALLERLEMPLVLVDSDVNFGRLDHVMANNRQGAFEATMHLLQAGHRNVAFVGDPESAWSFGERERGFEEAVSAFRRSSEAGVETVKIRGIGVSGNGNYVRDSFPEQLRQAVHAHRVTGLFCANDMLALETIRQLKAWNLDCPADVSVVGFDDVALAELSNPGLTTVRVPKESIGSRAVKLLLERIRSGRSEPELIQLYTELVARGSVRRLDA
jgi:DNA-binding LacI/PurR family transcriptional regulator